MIKSDRLQDAIIVKQMNGKIFVTCVQSIALNGVPEGQADKTTDAEISEKKKLKESISRSKRNVLEIAYCNNWDWFGTFTFDKQKTKDRYNVQQTMKEFRLWLNNFKKRHAPELKYLLVPELHKDGAVHVHGLLSGIPSIYLKSYAEYSTQEIIDNDWATLAMQGYYNLIPYYTKFGRNSFGEIKSNEATAFYVSKYINKDMVSAVEELNLHTYYATQGLKRAERVGIFDTNVSVSKLKWDWQDSYIDRDTGEIVETCTYKRTFNNMSEFNLWLKMNNVVKIKD